MIEEIKQYFIKNIAPIVEEYNRTNQEFAHMGEEFGRVIQIQSSNLEDLSRFFQSIFASVQLTSEATQVMDKEIKEIKELGNLSINSLDGVINTIEQLTSEVHKLTDQLGRIREHSSQLKNAIAEIVKISEMTIVASRNAQIKAYHAGEMGRGFEVIAKQMVGLVGQTETATSEIPKVTERIDGDVAQLSVLVDGMQKFLEKFEMVGEYLNDSFRQILSLIPNLEKDTTETSRLIAEQEKNRTSLVASNRELTTWLSDTFEISEKASSALIFLKGLASETINASERTKTWHDDSQHNFFYFLNRFLNILTFTTEGQQKWERKVPQLKGVFDFQGFANTIEESKTTSRDIRQSIVRQSTDLKKSQGILETALETLNREMGEETSIFRALSEAENSLNELRDLPGKVLFFEQELNAIVERSRILSLYAAIESARAGEFSQALVVVTEEIKNLADQTKNSVVNITQWRESLIGDFDTCLKVIKECKKIAQEERRRLNESTKIIDETLRKIKELRALITETDTSLDQQLSNFSVLSEQLKKIIESYDDIITRFDRYLKTGITLTRILEGITNYRQEFIGMLGKLVEEKEPAVRLIIRESADPIILDPAFKTDVISDRICQQIHIGLLSFDDEGSIVPGAASDFSISEDGRTWTFYLRKDIKFHNGRPLTSADVLYSIERIKTGPNVSFVEYIEEVRAIDDHTVQLRLRYPYLPLLANLACGTCLILPRQGYDPIHPIGAGPYRFARWERNQELILKANDSFFEGRPSIDELVYRVVGEEQDALNQAQSGKISVMEIQQAEIDESGFVCHRSPSLSTQYLAINLSKDTPFRIKEIRQAMNYIFDKEKYVKVLHRGRGIPAKGVFPPGLSSYNPNLEGYPYDPDKAKFLMNKAGFGQGLSEAYEVDTRDAPAVLERTGFICEALGRIGIKTRINAIEWKDLLRKTYSGQSLLSMRGWVSDNGDPDNFLYPLYHSRSWGESGNITFYKNSEIDKMIETARQIRNFVRRMEYYQAIETKIVEDAPSLFLNHGLNYFIQQRDVFNLRIDPFGLIRVKYIFKRRWNKS